VKLRSEETLIHQQSSFDSTVKKVGPIGPDDDMKILAVLDSLNYIKAKRIGTIQKSHDGVVDQYAISLTPKGKALFQKAARKNREKETWWRISLVKLGIKQITGIALEGDKVTATVQFTLHPYDKTPIADLIISLFDDSDRYFIDLFFKEVDKTVQMRKYDDGWRIEENRKRRR
jgi:hypothetical protein